MPFADTDFILALIKDDDWLKERATTTYDRYKDELWISPHVISELLLICKRLDLDPEKIIVHTYRLVKVRDLEEKTALLAAHYIKQKKINVFDALHAAYAQFDEIISSDHIFDELGLDRIKLEKEYR
ncbi:MAG: PIN domain-containing protein [Candidatus Micrarchaeota archaeon]|nr:PIN domain-containing protein [Candidatus Micrarchaeota archaeon]